MLNMRETNAGDTPRCSVSGILRGVPAMCDDNNKDPAHLREMRRTEITEDIANGARSQRKH